MNVTSSLASTMVSKTLLFLLFAALGCTLVSGLDDFVCTDDSECLLSGYHCCKGTIWCCDDGYICTGSSTCISIGVIVGPIVAVVVIGIAIGVLIWYRKCRRVNRM